MSIVIRRLEKRQKTASEGEGELQRVKEKGSCNKTINQSNRKIRGKIEKARRVDLEESQKEERAVAPCGNVAPVDASILLDQRLSNKGPTNQPKLVVN